MTELLPPHPNAVNASLVEQATGEISARYNAAPDIALEMLRGLARSQQRDLDEYAAAVVANQGRLDA
jgi:hypothetical protein